MERAARVKSWDRGTGSAFGCHGNSSFSNGDRSIFCFLLPYTVQFLTVSDIACSWVMPMAYGDSTPVASEFTQGSPPRPHIFEFVWLSIERRFF